MKKWINQHFTKFLAFTLFCSPLYLLRLHIAGLPTNALDILLFIAIFLWIAFIRPAYKKLPAGFAVAALLILLGTLLSSITNGITLSSIGILKSWFVLPMLFGYICYASINSNEDIFLMLKAMFYSGLTLSIIGIFYILSGRMTYDHRLSAFFESPNQLAMAITPSILVGLYFLVNKKRRFLFFISTLLMVICLYVTFSFSAWFALLFSSLFFVFPYFKRTMRASFLILAGIMFFLALVTAPKFQILLADFNRSSINSRIMIWKAASELIATHPITGIGPGNFQSAYLSIQAKFPPYLEWAVPHPHNIFLAFWLGSGILGLIGFLYVVAYLLALLIQKTKNSPAERGLFLLLLAYFISFLSVGLFDTPYWKNDLALVFWFFSFMTLRAIDSNQ